MMADCWRVCRRAVMPVPSAAKSRSRPGPGIAPETESERRGLLAALHSVKVDASVREAAIRLRREHRLKIPDAIIAASALTHDAILLTNDQRLLTVPGLKSQTVEFRRG